MAERVGRYMLDEVIGVGSFATVHRAVDTHLDDIVVVKILAENHSLNPEVRERFIAEGRSLRRVSSSHVVTIHDIGESDRQQPYLVLSYADRGTLADRVTSLRERGWVAGPADVLHTARSLAAAVDAVHRASLVHRDLSPGNVLLTSAAAPGRRDPQRGAGTGAEDTGGIDGADGAVVVAADERLVVADLGMCKDLAMNSGLTVAGGTSGFRPPEQDGPGLIDIRADLWAMSRLLLWMCEGAEAALPPALFTALRRSTATDPSDRHPDAGAWLADIENALASPTPTAVVPPAPQGPPDQRRRRRPVALTGVAVAALLAGVAFVIGAQYGAAAPSQSGEAAIAIDGPVDAVVGQEVTFAARTLAVDTWVWTLPTGAHVVDAQSVSITARSPGPAQVTLRARAPDGTDLETVHHIRVTE